MIHGVTFVNNLISPLPVEMVFEFHADVSHQRISRGDYFDATGIKIGLGWRCG
jgi:hypothetical protein